MLPVGNRSGIPCGPFYDFYSGYTYWESEYSYWTGGTPVPLSAAQMLARFAVMKANNQRMIVGLSGVSSGFRTDGYFDLAKWKAKIDAVDAVGIDSYVADGTVWAHYIIDEPKSPNSWGGVCIPNNILDEMAAYSKGYWPTLPCVVRHEPLYLINRASASCGAWPGGDYQWEALDGAWLQYTTYKAAVAGGPICGPYMAANYASAQSQGLSLVAGCNWRDGGDGSSGVASELWVGKWTMSPTEISTYSNILLSDSYPDVSAWMMWRYVFNTTTEPNGSAYWVSAPMRAAFADLMDLCAARERRPMLRRLI